MKRLLCAILALMMVLALCGCSANKEPSSTITPTTEASTEASTEAPTEAPTEAATEGSVTLGRMAGGVYENAYAGFACTLDDSWEYYTAEELQDLSSLTQEMLQDTELMEQTGGYDQITDMMAECVDDFTSININYTRISLAERVTFALISEEDLLDATLTQKDMLVQTYAQMGIEVTAMDKVQVSFLGEDHFAIHTTASIEGTPYYILQLFRCNLGGQYYVTLTLASFVEDNTGSLLDLFTPL